MIGHSEPPPGCTGFEEEERPGPREGVAVLTLGALCRQVRQSRNLRLRDVARLGGIADPTVKRLEDGRIPSTQTFSGYVGALCSPEVGTPLTSDQAAFLWRCFDAAAETEATEAAFAGVSSRELARPRPARQLRRLLDTLAGEPYPAYIRDEQFFIHAMNAPLLRLVGATPDTPGLSRWQWWHNVAATVAPDSPLGAAYDRDTFVPALVRYFMRTAVDHLFTVQMGALLQELCRLSPDGFAPWWRAAQSLLLPAAPQALPRTARIQGDLVQFLITRARSASVELAPGYATRFTMGCWRPLTEATEAVLRKLDGHDDIPPVILAADYDVAQTFHVNDWPPVRRVFEERMRRGEV